MQVARGLDELTAPGPGAVVTIGAYDGVHLGHGAVLRLVRELADARGMQAACATFDRHPAEVVRPDSAPKPLTTLDQKLELLAATGFLDACLVIAFDEKRSQQRAEEFVHEVLVDGMDARLVVVGADFHFGHGRAGNVALLERMGAELGFEVLGLGLVAIDGAPSGTPYSSTEIRRLLAEGEVAAAARLLGRPHEVRGVVEPGDQRGGSLLGFPTANLAVPERICLPADGVYTGSAVLPDGAERLAAISIGSRPTFYERGERLLEAHVLDFDGDLYGADLKVRFREWLHAQERYDTVEALVEQLHADVAATRRLAS